MSIYNIWSNLLIIYKHFLLFLGLDKEGILKIPGNKYIPNGEINDEPKLINVSLIKWYWVFLYIAQNIDK